MVEVESICKLQIIAFTMFAIVVCNAARMADSDYYTSQQNISVNVEHSDRMCSGFMVIKMFHKRAFPHTAVLEDLNVHIRFPYEIYPIFDLRCRKFDTLRCGDVMIGRDARL